MTMACHILRMDFTADAAQRPDVHQHVLLCHLISLIFSSPAGRLHPEPRLSALSGAGGEQTVRVQFPAGHSGLHQPEMDHH